MQNLCVEKEMPPIGSGDASDDSDSEPMVRCSLRNRSKNWQCFRMFPASHNRKMCPHHRAVANKKNGTEKSREWCRKHNATEKRKESRRTWNKSAAGIASNKKYRDSSKYQESTRAYWTSEAGKATFKRASKKITSQLTIALHHMVTDRHRNSMMPTKGGLRGRGLFVDNEDAKSFFASTFESWMSHENHGRYKKGDAYKTRWNIGHRLPVAIFDRSNDDDINKCFNRANLFAQCARENIELKDRLVLTDHQLLELRRYWPAKANDDLETLKSLYRTSDVPKARATIAESSEEEFSESEFEDEVTHLEEVGLAEDLGVDAGCLV